MSLRDKLKEELKNNKLDFNNGGKRVEISVDDNDEFVIQQSINVDDVLKANKLERDNFQRSSNTQDHWQKVASVPALVVEHLEAEAIAKGVNPRDQTTLNKYVLERIKSPEFEYFLTVPKNYLRAL